MEFTFSPEQEALRDAVRATLAAEAPMSFVRRMVDDERGFTDRLWQTMARLGWLGLLVPEDAGGLGLGLVDMAVVQEEMGRAALPGPYLSSAVLATLAARALGATELLTPLASGERRGTVAVEELGHGDPLGRIATRASRSGDRWELEGLKPVVLDGHTADWVIVLAREDGGALAAFAVEGPAITDVEPVPVLDVTRKVARLRLSGTPASRLGPDGDQTALWRRVVDDVTVAVAAETVGACERALEEAVAYAQTRVQFDRPIAGFQVIRHKAVDMLHRLELARVGTHYAAWASDVDDPQREQAVAMTKGYVGEAAVAITADDIQIHGGMGFTWDVDAHLFYRRAKQNDLLFGSQSWQRQRLAGLIL
ncbi:MAG TPA: acyl-CoA dehydrogenase family protein [Acidimicrobiales bacterium]|nr:acyl-CoA dehydrogenase family protein [Acidimicrobiales bacterium]